MATNNFQDTLKKYFYSGVGLAANTADVVQKSVNDLVKKGKVSEADGKKIIGEAIKKAEAKRPEIEAKYNETVHKFVKLTNSEIDKLQKKISKLESQLIVRKGGSSASKPSVKASAKPVKKATKKKVAKKVSKPVVAKSSTTPTA